MDRVQVNQTPPEGGRQGRGNGLLAVVVLVLILVVAWFIVEQTRGGNDQIDVDVNVPSEASGGSSGGGSAPGSGVPQ